MCSPDKTIILYISNLHKEYTDLNKILKLESSDIEAEDEISLMLHVEMEAETVKRINSLTKTIRTYMDNSPINDEGAEKLKLIEKLKAEAQTVSAGNIAELKGRLERLKTKIESIKLPQSARRVYYSGNNSSLMDIEV